MVHFIERSMYYYYRTVDRGLHCVQVGLLRQCLFAGSDATMVNPSGNQAMHLVALANSTEVNALRRLATLKEP